MNSNSTATPTSPDAVLSEYQSALAAEEQVLRKLSNKWRAFAFTRGGSFLICFVPLLLAARSTLGVNVPWLILSGVLFLVFLVIAFLHERMGSQIRLSRLSVKMHQESVGRITRKLEGVYMPPYEVPESVEAVSNDLDLFGEFSLYQLLAIARTPFGARTLGDWIAYPANVDEIRSRQIAVEELRSHQQWRQDFRLRCEQLSASQSGPSRFVQWAEGENWVARRQVLLWFCRLTSVISIAAILLLLFGAIPLIIAGPIVLGTMALNFLCSVFFAGSMHEIFNQISSHREEFSHYEILFERVMKFESQSPFLKEIQDDLGGRGHDVRTCIRSLGVWNACANFRRNGVFFILYLIFEFLFMWDIHILERMERWKDLYGRNVRTWFEALGRWEAVLALSKLAYDHPDWSFPKVANPQDNEVMVQCKSLGHPLMDHHSVTNDVEVGPAGTVLLVSGSNMSGKSTLLRSLGLNAVLAQMGSVVRAEQFTLPPLQIETSMRIVDSLAMGTSFFMAELKRLKEIVDLAEQLQTQDNQTLFFLLDEILQGTNSRERQIAVSKVVENLINFGAIGAISTHDLELATTKELKDACVPVHFTEQFVEVDGKKQMTFDYKMRRGIAETTNALKLLELVGLGEN